MKIEPRKDSKAVARRCSGRQLHLVMQGAGSIIIHMNQNFKVICRGLDEQ